MVDRKKVLEGLQCCVRSDSETECPTECPYYRKCWEDDYPDGDLALSLHKDALELLKKQPQWISVKDDLPKEHDSIFANHTHLSKHMWAKESDNVIVYVRFPDGTGTSTEGRLQDGKWWTRVSPMLEPVVTHWMPFPEPPEEVTQDDSD